MDYLAMGIKDLSDRVRRVQELRRSNAATPVKSKKKYSRSSSKQQLKSDIKDSPR
jgi:hypothetical protein